MEIKEQERSVQITRLCDEYWYFASALENGFVSGGLFAGKV